MIHEVATKIFSCPEDILCDPANSRLLKAAKRFSTLLARLGYPAPQTHSESALLKLAVTPSSKIDEIATSFETWSEWIEPIDPSKSNYNELEILMRALDKFGFEADDKFLKTVEENQVIEFYNEDMIQLYRSFNFYKITGYSLLDISLHEWYVLWERSRQAMEGVVSELNESLQSFIPVKQFQTKAHIVREVYDASQSKYFLPRAILLTPHRLGSLRSVRLNSSAKKGFICTSLGEVVAIGKEAENIEFI